MSGFSIDIADSALAKVGAGPLATAQRVQLTTKLDQAGTFSIDAPGTDPATAEVVAKRIAQLNALLGTPAARIFTTYGGGVVDSIDRHVDMATGEVTFTFSGDDLLGELANTSVLNLALDNSAGKAITVEAALALITPFVPTWTVDISTYASSGTTHTNVTVDGVTHPENFMIGGPIAGAGIPAGTTVSNIVGTTITLSAAATASATVAISGALIYLTFAGESVLTALNKVAAAVGHHFRQNGTGRGLVWLYKVQTSSGVRIISAGDGEALVNNDEVALLKDSLQITSDTHDVITRLYPSGGGNASARTTLNNATDAAPTGYTRHIDTDPQKSYIQHDAAVALYGIIERPMSYKDTSPGSSGTATDSTAATGNQVQTQAVETLRLHSVPLVTYRFSVVKLDKAVLPGQTVQLTFRRTADGYRAVDEDVTLVVMDSTLEWNADGNVRTTSMTVATVDRRPSSDIGTLVNAITTQASLDAHVQQAQLVQGLRVAAGQTLYVAPGASPSSGQALTWNSGTGQYEPTGVGGLTTAQTWTLLQTFSAGIFINGLLKIKRVTVAGSVTVGLANLLVGITSTAAARIMTLPAANTASGQLLIFVDESGGAAAHNISLAVTGGSGDSIVGSTAITVNDGWILCYSDGVNTWFARAF